MIDKNKHSRKRVSNVYQRKDVLFWVRRLTVSLAVVEISYYALICILSFLSAMDDYLKFSGLGFSNSYFYYLCKELDVATIFSIVLLVTEFFLYLIFQKKTKHTSSYKPGVYCFAAILGVHVVLLVLSCAIKIPDTPPFVTENGFGWAHRLYALETFLLALLYFISIFGSAKSKKEGLKRNQQSK